MNMFQEKVEAWLSKNAPERSSNQCLDLHGLEGMRWSSLIDEDEDHIHVCALRCKALAPTCKAKANSA